MRKSLRSLLKAAAYGLDQLSEGVDRGSDLMSEVGQRGRTMIGRRRGHAWNYVGSFAAGAGLGACVAVLFTPTSGKQTRDTIGKKLQSIAERVGEQFETGGGARPTGTEGP